MLDEATVVNRVLFGEFRKELRSLTEPRGDNQPALALTYRRAILSMVLSGVERFEPELLAHRDSSHALLELVVSRLRCESPVIDPYRDRLSGLMIRLVRKITQVECFPVRIPNSPKVRCSRGDLCRTSSHQTFKGPVTYAF